MHEQTLGEVGNWTFI